MMGSDRQFHALHMAALILLLAAVPTFGGPVRQTDQPAETALAPTQISNNAWLAPANAPSQAYPFQQPPQSTFQMIRDTDRTMVPLPSGEWTGLACLIGLALFRGRKAIWKMLS
jgi:hypothetical protein